MAHDQNSEILWMHASDFPVENGYARGDPIDDLAYYKYTRQPILLPEVNSFRELRLTSPLRESVKLQPAATKFGGV